MRVQLKEICNIHGGIAAPKPKDAYTQDGIPFVRMKDLGQYHLTSSLIETQDSLNVDYLLNKNIKIIPKGSILLPRSGSVSLNHRAVLGTDAIIVSHICALEVTSKKVNNLYLYYYLIVRNIENIIKRTTGLDAITFTDLGKLYVDVPSLEIQNYFVRSLQIIERITQKRQQTIEILTQLVKAVFLEMFGDPFLNEKKWEKHKISQIGKISTGNTPPRNNKEYYADNYLEWIKTDNINIDQLYVSRAKEYLSEKGANKGRVVNENAILVACIAGSLSSIGNSALTNRRVAFNQQINAIEPSANFSPSFLLWQMRILQKYIQRFASSGMKKIITKGNFENIELICPDIDEQKKFEKISLVIHEIKEKLQNSQEQLNELFQSLLQKAFEGKLEFEKEKILEDILPNLKAEELLTDIKLLKSLLQKIENQDFKTGNNYKLAQNLLFQLLDNEKSGVFQQCDVETENLEIKHEAN